MSDTILEIRDLRVHFPIGKTLFNPGQLLKAVDGVNIEVKRGEVFSVVGESGCGKSTIAKTILGIQEPTAGEIILNGQPLSKYSRAELASKVQPIFQDPYSSLNPRKTIESLIAMPLLVRGVRLAEIRESVAELMEAVRLPRRLTHAYPSQPLRWPAAKDRDRPRTDHRTRNSGLRRTNVCARCLSSSPSARPAGKPPESAEPDLSHHQPRSGRAAPHLGSRGRDLHGAVRRGRNRRASAAAT